MKTNAEFKPVSVIIPVYNEENTIIGCIKSLTNGYQVDKLEFIIADGGSTDRTLENIKNFSSSNPGIKIKVVNNPQRTQGHGLNIAIENAGEQNEIILRADAHSVYPENYIRDCAQTLSWFDADNAGGVMVPVGKTPFQKAVAFCMSHPLGVGDAKFHLGNYSGFVDTVYLGCFRREVFKKVGLFDPAMTPSEDAEFNLRIINSGGKIYLNGNIRVDYFPRDDIVTLIKQYYRYGQGRCRVVKKHKKFTSVRQIVPPLWIVFTVILLSLSVISKMFVIPLIAYLSVVFLVSVNGALKNKEMSILLASIGFIIMHYAWGLGFLNEFLSCKNFTKSKTAII